MRRSIPLTIATTGLILLAGCSGSSEPEVTPAPTSAAAEETPEPTPDEVATTQTTGTRESPMAIGEARKLSNESAWTVSVTESNLDAAAAIAAQDAYAPTPAEGETFVVATVNVVVDGSALAAQGGGGSLESDGANAAGSVSTAFVAADGTSYTGLTGTMCYTSNPLYSQAPVYSDGASVTGDVCIAVPSDKVEGGLWRLTNHVNEGVWVASA